MELNPVNPPLDTAFINLASLIRYLQRRFFVGALRVTMPDYEAEIVLAENSPISVTELNIADGQKLSGTAALERLLIRTREPGGAITVWNNLNNAETETASVSASSSFLSNDVALEVNEPQTSFADNGRVRMTVAPMLAETPQAVPRPLFSPEFVSEKPFDREMPQNLAQSVFQRQQTSVTEWREVVHLAGDIILTIEVLICSMNMNFTSIFESVRRGLAEDYPFLDPRREKFVYSEGKTELREFSSPKIFLNGLSIALRQTIETAELIMQSQEFRSRLKEQLHILIEENREQLEKFNALSNLEYIVGETFVNDRV